MATVKSLIPKSRAKTAYGLVSDVVRAILEEPKRVDMNTYGRRPFHGEKGPACGTVGCFAGWVAALSGMDIVEENRFADYRVQNRARELLGPEVDYLIVGPFKDHVFNAGDGDGIDKLSVGTRRYANAVARRIRKFQRINAKALKAQRLSATK